MQAREEVFTVGGLRLSAKRWGSPGGLPVLALHGWLDNAASFDFMAPHLPGYDLVCLDCAGHGKSQHRGLLGAYNIWQDVAELFAVADALGWESFALVGHSRGAAISFLAAGTFPQRISHLVMLEGGYPRVAVAEQAPILLAESIRAVRLATVRPRQYYRTFDQAVTARARGIVPIDERDAEVLARHGVQETEQGFFWSYDARLIAGSELRLSAEQVEAFRQRVTARTLLVAAEQGFLVDEPKVQDWLTRSVAWTCQWLPGNHHFHMHTQCVAVATAIDRHFANA